MHLRRFYKGVYIRGNKPATTRLLEHMSMEIDFLTNAIKEVESRIEAAESDLSELKEKLNAELEAREHLKEYLQAKGVKKDGN